jgi:hypothetical protein
MTIMIVYFLFEIPLLLIAKSKNRLSQSFLQLLEKS